MLDYFMVEDLMDGLFQFNSWVSIGGFSDHLPIMFHMATGEENPPSLFKFNHSWILEEAIRT
jgi:hypothetical protein